MLAKCSTRGVDLQILTRGKIASADYELTVNGGFLHNEIVALNEGDFSAKW